MTLDPHRITLEQLRGMGSGISSPAELAILTASQRSKTLAALATAVRAAAQSGHPDAAAASAGWELLACVQHESPAAFEATVRHPSVGAWALDAAAVGEETGPSSARGRLALVAAAAAIRGGVSCSVTLPSSQTSAPTLHLPSLGSVILPRAVRGHPLLLRHEDHTTQISGPQHTIEIPPRLDASTPRWRPLTRATAEFAGLRLDLAIDDADPYRLPQLGLPLSQVAGPQRTQWRERIAAGWRLLAGHHPQAAADVLTLISALTPLSGAGGAPHSITSRRVFGAIGLTLPADDVSMALTLAHEVQHAKLYAVMDLLPLVAGQAAGLYYAPWRPDPRPLTNLLQGMYAHLGAARFWRLNRRFSRSAAEVHRAHVEFYRWRKACVETAHIISAQPELTPYGAVFMEGVLHVLREWKDEHVPPEARTEAVRAAAEHRRNWEAGLVAPSDDQRRNSRPRDR
jgi:uncharacterized protein